MLSTIVCLGVLITIVLLQGLEIHRTKVKLTELNSKFNRVRDMDTAIIEAVNERLKAINEELDRRVIFDEIWAKFRNIHIKYGMGDLTIDASVRGVTERKSMPLQVMIDLIVKHLGIKISHINNEECYVVEELKNEQEKKCQ